MRLNSLPSPPAGGILEHIQSFLNGNNIPSYRFRQLVHALQQGSINFEDVKELPKPLRELLISRFGTTPLPLTIVESHTSRQVEKILFETKSKAKIETVRSHYRSGWTSMCISSQSGCGLGCSFCATAAMGLMRNLTADEICAQVFHAYWQNRLPDSIAFMGMGEALANPHIFTAIKAFTTKGYGGLSPRRITVSTVGFAPNLERLVQTFPHVTITLSVHSPFSAQRAELIPLEKKFSLADNLAVLDQYVRTANRKVYLAYLLIRDINDTDEHLDALTALVKAQYRPELYHISVIRYNNAFGADAAYQPSSAEKVLQFVAKLQAKGLQATKRTQFGSGIEAACGQLHASYEQKKKHM